MADFAGHLNGGIFFIALSLWWIYKGFTKHIKASSGNKNYEIAMSYLSNICGRQVPVEQMAKVFVLVIVMTVEQTVVKIPNFDEKGQVVNVAGLLHLSFYLPLLLHAIVDLLQSIGFKHLPPKMDFITAALGFGWLGISLYYHLKMEQKSTFDKRVHVFWVYPSLALCIVILLITKWTSSFALDFLRCFFLSLLGSWLCQTAFLMNKPGFPGTEPNLAWNNARPENVHFIAVLFGFHVFCYFTILLCIYAFLHWIMTRKQRYTAEYSSCQSIDMDTEASQKILGNDKLQFV